jgi:hypothetical protein
VAAMFLYFVIGAFAAFALVLGYVSIEEAMRD